MWNHYYRQNSCRELLALWIDLKGEARNFWDLFNAPKKKGNWRHDCAEADFISTGHREKGFIWKVDNNLT